MIRVHTGRGWRYNPHLLAELRAVGGRGARHPPIVDVLGVEVDGVDLFSGLAEDRIVEVTADLAAALSRLASGHRRAQVPCSGGAVELLLERRANNVLLTMVRLLRPSDVLILDLEIDLEALCSATLSSARGLLEELRRIHPRLVESAAAERLARSLAGALGKPPRPCPPAPAAIPAARRPTAQLLAQSRPTQAAGFRLEILDEDSLFESFAGGRADLHSLIAPGVLLLEPCGALPAWSGRGIPFLLLKDLVQSGLEVVRAVEEGDPEHELPLGNGVSLQLRLGPDSTASFVRDGPRGRQEGAQGFQACEPVPLLSVLFQAALAFGGLATRRNSRQAQNQPLVTLLSDAHEGLARCRELTAEPPALAAVPRAAVVERGSAPEPRLAPGRLRLLNYREVWRTKVPLAVQRLQRTGDLLLAHGDGWVAGLSPARGKIRWAFKEDGALADATPGLALAAIGNRIMRADQSRGLSRGLSRGPSRGARWEALALPGPIRSLACAGESKARTAVAATDFEVVSFDAGSGNALWRFSPPGAARLAVHPVRGLLVISTGDGRLYGIRPLDGRLLWRARGRLFERPTCHQEWLLAIGRDQGELTGVSLRTGVIRQFGDLDMTRVAGAASTDWGLAVSGVRGSEGTVVGLDADGRARWSWAQDDRLGPARPLLVPVARGLLVRSARSLSRLEADGSVRWSHPLSDQSHDGVMPVRRRGVVISAGDAGLFAFDEESGAVLGQVDGEQPIAALAIDGKLNIYLAAHDGPVRALQVQRFLSVV